MDELFNKNKFNSKKKRFVVTDISQEYKDSRNLIKEATSFKKTDIKKSIELIKEAILMIDEIVLSDYFKLSSYLQIIDIEQSYLVLDKLYNSFDKEEIGMYFMNLAQVDDKICVHHFKEKQYRKYLYSFVSWLRNTTIAFATQGRVSEFENMITNPNKLKYLAPTKIEKCFDKLSKTELAEDFRISINNYFESRHESLDSMVTTAKNVQMDTAHREEYKHDGTSGNFSDYILINEHREFMDNYNQFISESFETIYINKIEKTLNF
jgi:hypothetical protein